MWFCGYLKAGALKKNLVCEVTFFWQPTKLDFLIGFFWRKKGNFKTSNFHFTSGEKLNYTSEFFTAWE